MQIRINGHEIEFSIESEKTVGDILSSFEQWAASRGFVIAQSVVDGGLAAECGQKDLSEVQVIDFTVQSKGDLLVETLNEAAGYCDRISEYIESGKIDKVRSTDIADGLHWLEDILQRIFNLMEIEPSSIPYLGKTVEEHLVHLKKIAQTVASDITIIKNEKSFIAEIKGITRVLLVSDRMREIIIKAIDSPDSLLKNLEDLKSRVSEHIVKLEEISALFQSGRDASASEKMQEFIDFLYMYIRLSCQIKPVFGIDLSDITFEGSSMNEVNDGINMLLNEVVSVMENNDIISLSDILEYELKPMMEKLPTFLDELAGVIYSKN